MPTKRELIQQQSKKNKHIADTNSLLHIQAGTCLSNALIPVKLVCGLFACLKNRIKKMSVFEQRMSVIHKGTRTQESCDFQHTHTHARTLTRTRTHTHDRENESGPSSCDLEGGFVEYLRRECWVKQKWAMLVSWPTQTVTHTRTHTQSQQC